MDIDQFPILYSFRRCPYAMRARLAIKISNIKIELREVVLRDKPKSMLSCSPKGTVPVLQLTNGTVIDESLDIMEWVLTQNDPDNWLLKSSNDIAVKNHLIEVNDNEFKIHLDHYKYADRFPEKSTEYYRELAESFIQELDDKLNETQYLINDNITIVDMAILPFIRQFAYVDKKWFDQAKYTKLQVWLNDLIDNPLFHSVMKKHPQWIENDSASIYL